MKMRYLLIAAIWVACSLNANDDSHDKPKPDVKAQKEALKEETSVTEHTVKINGVDVKYKATAGTIFQKDEKGENKATIFYVAYIKEGVEDNTKRPIMFCFNGGPGSASIWLHIGLFGPRKVSLTEDGYALPPYRLVNNEYSILDDADLIFIDPVSTGYSRAAPGVEAKEFHGVEEDIKSVGEFIRIFVTRFNRWDSPKFLAGESYGTTRAAGLAGYLHDEYNMYLNGVILISSILNFQTLNDSQNSNDLPYILFLPSYASTAWYHKRLPDDLQNLSLDELLAQVKEFSMTEYALALLKGDAISEKERAQVIQKLSRYTGLSAEYIDRSDLRYNVTHFGKELLRFKKRNVGRFDSRFVGIDSNPIGETTDYDPSADAIFGVFTSSFNYYLRNDLKWEKDEEYKILANVWPWNFGNAQNQYLNVSDTLRNVMTKNPSLRIFVGNGYYDLATPFFATEYTFSHLGLDPSLMSHVTMGYYDAGHMMYIHYPSLIKMKKDISEFIANTLKVEHPPTKEPVNGNPKDAF